MKALDRYREVSHVHSRWTIIAIGVGSLLAALGMVLFSLAAPDGVPTSSYYTVQAPLRDATGLFPHAQVREDGRLVGQVLRPRVENGHPTVTLQLFADTEPLPVDTRVSLRGQSAVGMGSVLLQRGTDRRTVPDGGSLRLGDTAPYVTGEDALQGLDAHTRRRTQQLLGALGPGLADRGWDLHATLRAAPSLFRDQRAVAGALLQRPGAVARAVRESARGLGALDRAREDLAEGFDPARRALAPLAEHDEGLTAALREAPGAFAALRADLPQSDRLVDELAGLTRTALPALRRAPGALRATTALLQTGRRTLPAAVRTLGLASRAAGPTLTFLQRADPVSPRLSDLASNLQPLLATAARYACDLVRSARNWGEYVRYGNAGGNYVRVLGVAPTTSSLAGQTRHLSPAPEHRNAYPEPCTAAGDRAGRGR
ncbi:MAG TPA: MlaD family protein [Baekduia sp.]|nr:MlaD family protein [Baekduia sp.]